MADVWSFEHGNTTSATATTVAATTALVGATNTEACLVDNASSNKVHLRFGLVGMSAATSASQVIPANSAIYVYKGANTHFSCLTISGTADVTVSCGQFKHA